MSALYLVVGPAGSGKSGVARRLAQRVGGAYLDKDDVAAGFTEALLAAAGTDPHGRDDNPYYRDVVMDLEYAALWRLAAANLRLDRPVVLDAPFLRWFDEKGHLGARRREHAVPDTAAAVVVQVHADGATVRERVARRGLARDRGKLADWDRFWASAGARTCHWTGATHVTLDNSADDVPVDDLVDRLLAAVPG
ncbi:ATP-binding protein [Pseudonocardia sp. DR1-2]|uniref:AAA family ATPase n=1 Tax=Pseudonocardia sp. DR1-2 TaxID=2951168 RepID=UPI0020448102|nr:AAA family ATPase [Pseudonocardia sp. DR1-2]MCM3847166.1 ATP-binding protein [Pseudonocardia sp. DR1-2]